MSNMATLWAEARLFGLVYLHTCDDGLYFCRITFNTIAHTSLEATSDFKNKTPEAALQMAIDSAKKIVASMVSLNAKMLPSS